MDFIRLASRLNSEVEVFPAIFGTVLLVLIMSVIVMPLRVITAAVATLMNMPKNNAFTRLIRCAVINLRGLCHRLLPWGIWSWSFLYASIGARRIGNVGYTDGLPAPADALGIIVGSISR
ncbi:hypothetical protein ACT691_16765 [Vibrio metschnikovii]